MTDWVRSYSPPTSCLPPKRPTPAPSGTALALGHCGSTSIMRGHHDHRDRYSLQAPLPGHRLPLRGARHHDPGPDARRRRPRPVPSDQTMYEDLLWAFWVWESLEEMSAAMATRVYAGRACPTRSVGGLTSAPLRTAGPCSASSLRCRMATPREGGDIFAQRRQTFQVHCKKLESHQMRTVSEDWRRACKQEPSSIKRMVLACGVKRTTDRRRQNG